MAKPPGDPSQGASSSQTSKTSSPDAPAPALTSSSPTSGTSSSPTSGTSSSPTSGSSPPTAATSPSPSTAGAAPKAARVKRRVVVLYNCDFDVAVPTALDLIDDRSAVKRAANQVRDAVEEFGYEAIIEGVFGHDVARCL